MTLLAGCASPRREAQPAPLLHLVYFQLQDGENADALHADCDDLLAGIPSVASYASGRHLETGRISVTADYDLFLLVGFQDEADYLEYLGHASHLELVRRWQPKLKGLRIHDVSTARQPAPTAP